MDHTAEYKSKNGMMILKILLFLVLLVDFQIQIIWIIYEKIFSIKSFLLEQIMADGK